ncbi:hypothetical protein [Streptomyces luteireticuli]|uniref:hypothetical protein n=1 Tax=Streptomyces luteireticuli TaxID=173858 RepID=UPI003557474A
MGHTPDLSMSAARSSRQDRRSAVWTAAWAIVFAIAAGVLLLGVVPRLLAEQRDFEAATACPAGVVSQDCERPVAATVQKTWTERHNKTTKYWIRLTESDGSSHTIRMSGEEWDERPVFRAVKAGDRVTDWYWRGQVRFIEFKGVRQDTHEVPTNDYRIPAGIGMALIPFSLVLFWSAYWLARKGATSPLRSPWQLAVPQVAGLWVMGVGPVSVAFTPGMTDALWFTALGSAPGLLVAAVWAMAKARADRRKGTDTIEVTPRIPEQEEHFPGFVIGDVPYSMAGFGHLVAGPGYLASTPDPTGRIARRTVPRTLVVERVRPPYRWDPGDNHKGCWIAECRDGEEQVLIAAEDIHMPWILGALEPVPATTGTH